MKNLIVYSAEHFFRVCGNLSGSRLSLLMKVTQSTYADDEPSSFVQTWVTFDQMFGMDFMSIITSVIQHFPSVVVLKIGCKILLVTLSIRICTTFKR